MILSGVTTILDSNAIALLVTALVIGLTLWLIMSRRRVELQRTVVGDPLGGRTATQTVNTVAGGGPDADGVCPVPTLLVDVSTQSMWTISTHREEHVPEILQELRAEPGSGNDDVMSEEEILNITNIQAVHPLPTLLE